MVDLSRSDTLRIFDSKLGTLRASSTKARCPVPPKPGPNSLPAVLERRSA